VDRGAAMEFSFGRESISKNRKRLGQPKNQGHPRKTRGSNRETSLNRVDGNIAGKKYSSDLMTTVHDTGIVQCVFFQAGFAGREYGFANFR
jgi:hypothetical protein